MIARFHYDRSQLHAFLNGGDDSSDAEMASHLETCRDCQAELESMAESNFDWHKASELLGGVGYQRTEAQRDYGERLDAHATFLQPSDDTESIGRFARYEIREIIGRGGMGIVMRAFDPSLGRYCAVKILAPELAGSAAAKKRFSREAKSAAAVVHPHVVPIQTVDEHDGLPYLVMPLVEGQSLQQRVEATGPLSVIETVRIAAQVAQGLAAAHEQGLVHRDIKPANILLENGVERVQITDFGLARAVDDASMTRSGVIAGTPQYMSPEQAHGDSIDHRSDLFSLGSVIYFMLTGRSPFRAETTMGVLNRIGNDAPRPLRSVNAEVPAWLEAIVNRLLSKVPSDRYASANEVSDLLQNWHAHLQSPETVPAPASGEATSPPTKDSSPRPLPKHVGKLPSVRWLVGLAAFVFFAVFGTVFYIETDKGTLRIESSADANVPIVIRQGDEVIEQLSVSIDGSTMQVRRGHYIVEVAEEGLRYKIDGRVVTVERGGETVITISSEPLTEAQSPMPTPTATAIEHPEGPDAGLYFTDRVRKIADTVMRMSVEQNQSVNGSQLPGASSKSENTAATAVFEPKAPDATSDAVKSSQDFTAQSFSSPQAVIQQWIKAQQANNYQMAIGAISDDLVAEGVLDMFESLSKYDLNQPRSDWDEGQWNVARIIESHLPDRRSEISWNGFLGLLGQYNSSIEVDGVVTKDRVIEEALLSLIRSPRQLLVDFSQEDHIKEISEYDGPPIRYRLFQPATNIAVAVRENGTEFLLLEPIGPNEGWLITKQENSKKHDTSDPIQIRWPQGFPEGSEAQGSLIEAPSSGESKTDSHLSSFRAEILEVTDTDIVLSAGHDDGLKLGQRVFALVSGSVAEIGKLSADKAWARILLHDPAAPFKVGSRVMAGSGDALGSNRALDRTKNHPLLSALQGKWVVDHTYTLPSLPDRSVAMLHVADDVLVWTDAEGEQEICVFSIKDTRKHVQIELRQLHPDAPLGVQRGIIRGNNRKIKICLNVGLDRPSPSTFENTEFHRVFELTRPDNANAEPEKSSRDVSGGTLPTPQLVAKAYYENLYHGRFEASKQFVAGDKFAQLLNQSWFDQASELIQGIDGLGPYEPDIRTTGDHAVAVFQELRFYPALPEVGTVGRLVIQLEKQDGNWRIVDVDIWSDKDARQRLRQQPGGATSGMMEPKRPDKSENAPADRPRHSSDVPFSQDSRVLNLITTITKVTEQTIQLSDPLPIDQLVYSVSGGNGSIAKIVETSQSNCIAQIIKHDEEHPFRLNHGAIALMLTADTDRPVED